MKIMTREELTTEAVTIDDMKEVETFDSVL
jgi:hypothetical protein